MAQLSVRLTSIKWRDYLAAHVPAITLALMVGTEVWIVATLMRGLAASHFIVLLTSLSIMVGTLILLLRLSPKLVLGDDGVWLLCRIAERVPARFMLIARLKKNLERALVSPSSS